MRIGIVGMALLVVGLAVGTASYTQPVSGSFEGEKDAEKMIAVVAGYHKAFTSNQADEVADYLGPTLFMFNGASSDDVKKWQAHLYLAGEELQEWPVEFLNMVAPYQHELEVLSSSVRGESGLVVTRETGKHKFRSFENEKRVYLMARTDDGWKIIGIFIPDMSNPE